MRTLRVSVDVRIQRGRRGPTISGLVKLVYSRERRSIAGTGGTSSSHRTTCRSMLCGRKVSTECSTGAPSAVQVTCSISSAAVVVGHRQRPADRVALGQHPRHDVRAVVGHGHALLEQDVEHHLTALQRAAQPRGRGQGDARMHDVAHVGAGDAVHDQDARDRRRRGLRIEREEPARARRRARAARSPGGRAPASGRAGGRARGRRRASPGPRPASTTRRARRTCRCPGGARSRRSPPAAAAPCAACRARSPGAPTAPARVEGARPRGGARSPASGAAPPRRRRPATPWARAPPAHLERAPLP